MKVYVNWESHRLMTKKEAHEWVTTEQTLKVAQTWTEYLSKVYGANDTSNIPDDYLVFAQEAVESIVLQKSGFEEFYIDRKNKTSEWIG